MPMNLAHVESFLAVLEARSFSVAAARLGTVQSAVSAHVRALEESLGTRLLDRGRGRAVEPTAQGRAFAVDARRLLALADEIADRGRGRSPRPLRIATTATFALSVLPAILRDWRMQGPRPRVTVRTARSHEMREVLGGGGIDLALVLDQGRHPGRAGSVTAPLGWAVGRGFAPRPGEAMPLAFLADARDLRRHALAALDRAGQAAAIETHRDPVGLRAVVQSGAAATVMPACAIRLPLLPGGGPGLPALGSVEIAAYVRADAEGAEARDLAKLALERIAAGGGA